MFEIGKKVVSLSDFEDVRKIWGFSYPHKGDVLIVTGLRKHPRWEFLLLSFDECECELCDKNFAPIEEIGDKFVEEFINLSELLTPAGSSSETVQTSGSDNSALPLH